MKERIERTKNFVKEHKKGFLVGAGVALVGGVVFIVTKKKINLNKCVKNTTSLDVGVVEALCQDGVERKVVVNNLTVADMRMIGDLGNELLQSEGVTNETGVSGIFDFVDK